MPDLVSSVCLSSYCQQEPGHSNVESSVFLAESCPDIKIQVFEYVVLDCVQGLHHHGGLDGVPHY